MKLLQNTVSVLYALSSSSTVTLNRAIGLVLVRRNALIDVPGL